MAILLTGGAGFIGSHTAVELINTGYDVLIADDFSNCDPGVKERIHKITGHEAALYKIDVVDPSSVESIFVQNNIDGVIHFAGFKAVGESVSEPVKYYRNNIDTTLTILEAMKKHGVNKLIFSSSATVYGDPQKVPIIEDDPVGNCSNTYGRTKYFIEQILTDASKANSDMSVVLLRYFNPIGAHESGLIGERPNGIPNNLLPFITQTAVGIREKLNVFGNDYPTKDGTGVRDYIHVVDLAKGHVAALRYSEEHKGTEVFNLGTGTGYSVLEIIDAFEKATGIRIPYEIAARRPGDIAECYAGTEKAERILGWKAEKSIEDMCRDAWRWQLNCDKNIRN